MDLCFQNLRFLFGSLKKRITPSSPGVVAAVDLVVLLAAAVATSAVAAADKATAAVAAVVASAVASVVAVAVVTASAVDLDCTAHAGGRTGGCLFAGPAIDKHRLKHGHCMFADVTSLSVWIPDM